MATPEDPPESLYDVLSAQLEHEWDARHECSIHESTHRIIEALRETGLLASPDKPETCPTCGETGPDVFDDVGDYGGGPYEARCGDEWHDDEASPDRPEGQREPLTEPGYNVERSLDDQA